MEQMATTTIIQSATGAERTVTMTSIAFYLRTETTAVEEIVFSGADVNACWDRFMLEIGTSRSLAYTKDLGPQVPLVVFG
jgi:hypothetical protein